MPAPSIAPFLLRTLAIMPLAAGIGPAWAQPDAPAPDITPDTAADDPSLLASLTSGDTLRFRSITAYWDNDGTWPNLVNDSDRYYTSAQGFEFGFDFTPDEALAARLAPGWESPRFGLGLTIQQQIYTSSDISIADPDPDDHPYAGWLGLGVAFQRADEDRHDHFGLSLGIVGPDSFAEDIQKWIHEEIPDEIDPQGWDTQLSNEPALNLTYQRTWRTERADIRGVQMDMLPAVRLDAGNVYLRARAQATLRLGVNLPNDFGPASLQGFADHTMNGYWDPSNNWSVYGYATISADAVGRSIFLDGNTFEDSRSTDREVLVTRATLGIVARYKRVRLGWAQTWESKTFKAQGDGQTYGSIVVSYVVPF